MKKGVSRKEQQLTNKLFEELSWFTDKAAALVEVPVPGQDWHNYNLLLNGQVQGHTRKTSRMMKQNFSNLSVRVAQNLPKMILHLKECWDISQKLQKERNRPKK